MAKRKFGFLNIFGIMPTTNHDAAGYDFYIPLFPALSKMTEEETNTILEALEKSYKKTQSELINLLDKIVLNVTAVNGEEKAEQAWNILHLYLGLSSLTLNSFDTDDERLEFFLENYLIFDDNLKPGLELEVNDILFINSGVKTYFQTGLCGRFTNKSGRGTKGWNVLACLVDPDYMGYVHLNLGFTSDICENSHIYCGDKFVQMVVEEYKKEDELAITQEEFDKLHTGSKRGTDGFGSSNEKH